MRNAKVLPIGLLCSALWSFAAVATAQNMAHEHAQQAVLPSDKLGDVSFPNSGNDAAQAPFLRGLKLLHNFEYGPAAESFRAAQAADPNFALAYWGEAMTYNHPLWAEQDADAAHKALARLAPTAQARAAKANTGRERMWLAAVEALYGSGSMDERDGAYADRMDALFVAYPDDLEARTFDALATMGRSHGTRDIAGYMKAAALLEEALPSHPTHPGVLHYLIHAYDDPAHAPLGARAAARYSVVVPDAGHAQHMVSHIFLALGDWPRVEQANVRAMKVVNAQRETRGKKPTSCGHYNEWLVYALDQQGKDSSGLIESCRAEAFSDEASVSDRTVLGASHNLISNWAEIAVQHGVDTGTWPKSLERRGHLPGMARFTLDYAALVAARRNPRQAAAMLEMLRRDRATIALAMPHEWPDDHETRAWLDRAVAQGEAILMLARGRTSEGLQLLRKAAEAEAALPPPFGPPVLQKPSYELLGDELLAIGRNADAAEAYKRALAAAPNRRLSVLGLRAASARGASQRD